LERGEGNGPVRVILSQKKNNFGSLHPPLAFEFVFDGESVRVAACDPQDEPACEHKLPLASRIRNLLEDGTPRSSKEIALALGAKLNTIAVALSRGKKAGKWSLVTVGGVEKWTVLKSR